MKMYLFDSYEIAIRPSPPKKKPSNLYGDKTVTLEGIL